MSKDHLNQFESVRKRYGVKAYPGGQVIYHGGKTPMQCTIVGCDGQYLFLRENTDAALVANYHPTWKLEYLDKAKKVGGSNG